MPKKPRSKIPFDDRNLPINSMSKERMDELEERFAPYVEEIKHRLRAEFEDRRKASHRP